MKTLISGLVVALVAAVPAIAGAQATSERLAEGPPGFRTRYL